MDLEHADHSTLRGGHAAVGSHLGRLLHEGSLGSIELLKDDEGSLCGLLTGRGIGHGVLVGGLLRVALGGGLGHGHGELNLLILGKQLKITPNP